MDDDHEVSGYDVPHRSVVGKLIGTTFSISSTTYEAQSVLHMPQFGVMILCLDRSLPARHPILPPHSTLCSLFKGRHDVYRQDVRRCRTYATHAKVCAVKRLRAEVSDAMNPCPHHFKQQLRATVPSSTTASVSAWFLHLSRVLGWGANSNQKEQCNRPLNLPRH